jgi:hypothetical protein
MVFRLAAELFVGVLVVAGPILFIVFCMSFRQDRLDHPIYRRSENNAYQSEDRGEAARLS